MQGMEVLFEAMDTIDYSDYCKEEVEVLELFNFLKSEYGQVFDGLKLKFMHGDYINNCLGLNQLEEEGMIYICMNDVMQNKEIFEQESNFKNAINPNLSYLQFVFLHEVGHWLDFIDGNCTREDERGVQELMDIFEQTNPTRLEAFNYYKNLPEEYRADCNAIGMMKVLLEQGYKNG